MYLLLLAVHDSMESKVPICASLAIKLHYRSPDNLSLEKTFSVLQHVDCKYISTSKSDRTGFFIF